MFLSCRVCFYATLILLGLHVFFCRVIAGRTDGYLDFIEISYIPRVNLAATSAVEGHSKGHRRIRSLGNTVITWRETDIQCTTLSSVKAHQSTIGLLAIASELYYFSWELCRSIIILRFLVF